MTEQEMAVLAGKYLEDGFTSMADLKEKMPLCIHYETKYNGKERYNRIQEIFKEAGKKAVDLDFSQNADELADYMAALAECCPMVDEEVFDHYKNLETAFKETLHRLANPAKPGYVLVSITDPEVGKKIGKAITKACDAAMILEEKYRSLGEKLEKNGVCRGGEEV